MIPFALPPPKDCKGSPKWDGRNFVFDAVRTPVLEYSENFSGWSDDLTMLHEEAAGDSHPVDLASRRDAIAQVKNLSPAAGTVIMEIGCSSGYLIRELVKNFPDSAVIGADVVKLPLKRLAEQLPGVPLIRFDLLQCPLPDASVDILIMLNVLEHIEDDQLALEKAFNLLKPGGVLIIEVPAGPFLYDAYDAALFHFRRYSLLDLTTKLANAGFKVVRKSHLGFLLFPIFAVVKLLNKWTSTRDVKSIVRDQAARTSTNIFVRFGMKVELNYFSTFQLPFGIRALAVAKKAASH